MTICFSVSSYDDQLDIYNWIAGTVGDDEISLSNANGVDVLLAIGLEPEPAGIVPLSAFAGLITAALRRHLDRRSPAIETTSDCAPAGSRSSSAADAKGTSKRSSAAWPVSPRQE